MKQAGAEGVPEAMAGLPARLRDVAARALADFPDVFARSRSLSELHEVLSPATSFEDLLAVRSLTCHLNGEPVPGLARENLDGFLRQIWDQRESVGNFLDVYERYSGRTGARLVADGRAYLNRLVEVLEGRPERDRYARLQADDSPLLLVPESVENVVPDNVWFVRYDREGGGSGQYEHRVYVHPQGERVPELVSALVHEVLDDPQRFPGVSLAKVTGPAHARHDGIVIYVENLDAASRVVNWLGDFRAHTPEVFGWDVPAATRQVAPGVGIGAEPTGSIGERASFGSARSHAIRQALDEVRDGVLDDHGVRRPPTYDDFRRAVDHHLAAYGIDLERPHRNSGDEAPEPPGLDVTAEYRLPPPLASGDPEQPAGARSGTDSAAAPHPETGERASGPARLLHDLPLRKFLPENAIGAHPVGEHSADGRSVGVRGESSKPGRPDSPHVVAEVPPSAGRDVAEVAPAVTPKVAPEVVANATPEVTPTAVPRVAGHADAAERSGADGAWNRRATGAGDGGANDRANNTGAQHDPEQAAASHPDRLTAPVDDKWSRMDREQIVKTLGKLHGRDMNGRRVQFTGFDNPAVELDTVRECARAIDDVCSAYPAARAYGFEIVSLPDHQSGTTELVLRGDGKFTITVRLNERYATDVAVLRDAKTEAERNRYFVPGTSKRPIYTTVVHELGHVLGFVGDLRAEDLADETLMRHFVEVLGGPRDAAAYVAWLHGISGYGFNHDGRLNHPEALAEAFVDVFLNGDRASEPARVLHDLLIREADRGHSPAALKARVESRMTRDELFHSRPPGATDPGDPQPTEPQSRVGLGDYRTPWVPRLQQPLNLTWPGRIQPPQIPATPPPINVPPPAQTTPAPTSPGPTAPGPATPAPTGPPPHAPVPTTPLPTTPNPALPGSNDHGHQHKPTDHDHDGKNGHQPGNGHDHGRHGGSTNGHGQQNTNGHRHEDGNGNTGAPSGNGSNYTGLNSNSAAQGSAANPLGWLSGLGDLAPSVPQTPDRTPGEELPAAPSDPAPQGKNGTPADSTPQGDPADGGDSSALGGSAPTGQAPAPDSHVGQVLSGSPDHPTGRNGQPGWQAPGDLVGTPTWLDPGNHFETPDALGGNGNGAAAGMPPMMPPPMMPPSAPRGGGGGAFPRAGTGAGGSGRPDGALSQPAQEGAEITVQVFGGFGEYARFDPHSGVLRPTPAGAAVPGGLSGELGGMPVVFYRGYGGLVLHAGGRAVDLESPAVNVAWNTLPSGESRFTVSSGNATECDVRYFARSADTDLGLLIRDVWSDPSRRARIFTR